MALGGWFIIVLYTECNHITSIHCKSQFVACKIFVSAKSDYISAFESAFLPICMPFCKIIAFLQICKLICFSTNLLFCKSAFLRICNSANLGANLLFCKSAFLQICLSANLLSAYLTICFSANQQICNFAFLQIYFSANLLFDKPPNLLFCTSAYLHTFLHFLKCNFIILTS